LHQHFLQPRFFPERVQLARRPGGDDLDPLALDPLLARAAHRPRERGDFLLLVPRARTAPPRRTRRLVAAQMMRRNTIALAVLLVALAGYYYFFELGKSDTKPSDRLLTFKPEDAAGVALDFPGRVIVLQRDAQGRWKLAAPLQAPADDQTVA